MGSAKNQIIESREFIRTPHNLGGGRKKDGKMKVLPEMFMKTNEVKN